ncbi:nucleotidyltransferase [Stappia sp. 28M-7]|uniref:nucleotidyltransferase domain-containing protein n=1 Tax=Stappia sp. 28M-7 TaxID=2762596 RepID=UPI00163B6E32|nr:nucleotidyltransferase [Stappia sp. 28M-7]MBC2858366.1 nucleotidyltransferase [Stappia sp. 28M-7]
MAISEAQLETWSHQGSQVQSASTYKSIRDVLNDPGSPYYKWMYRIFLQGSYGNDTNIYADSDVDVVICLTEVYYGDVSHLSDEEKARYNANRSPGTIGFKEFKAHVLAWLTKKFGSGVTAGKKAIFIPGDRNRRDADVLVCVANKMFISYPATGEPAFYEGVCFWTSDEEKIVNYPRQHLDNCTAKNGASASRFKPSIRILKNMRNAMIEQGYINAGLAPSYFLEGMLSNVPTQQFVNSHQQTFENYMDWLQACSVGDLTCANGIHYLVRDGQSVCWNLSDFNTFRASAMRFYNRG